MARPHSVWPYVGIVPPAGGPDWVDLADAVWLAVVTTGEDEAQLAELSKALIAGAPAVQHSRAISQALARLNPGAPSPDAPGGPLTLALVLDASFSMAVWRPTVAAFRRALRHNASFQTVREFILSSAPDTDWSYVVGIRGSDTRRCDPRELIDPSGRQVFLVLTDGVGEHWRDPRTVRLLTLWGQSGPLAVINPFPQEYWHRSNISPRRARIRAATPTTPNGQLQVQYVESNLVDTPAEQPSVPVPVLELSPRWIEWWADLVASPRGWVDAMVYAADDSAPTERGASRPATPQPAVELVRRFRSHSSWLAFRLATYLAAAPLDPPLVRKVQRDLLPESSRHHLAEVVNSDLVRRAPGSAVSLDFVEGVRGALLACATRTDSAEVVRTVAAHYGHRSPTALALAHAIEAPNHDFNVPITPDTLPMARIALAVLTAWSGPYAPLAHRLRRAVEASGRQGAGADDHPGVPRTTAEAGAVADVRPQSTATPERPPFSWPDFAGLPEALATEPRFGQVDEARPTVWGNIPPQNLDFTGRQNLLRQLERRLRTKRVVALLPEPLRAMGGVGKSQIAIEYVHRHGAEYDVVWWVPSEQPAQILASLIELGERLGLGAGKEVTAASRVRDALRAGSPYSNWLLVFDNAETATLETVKDYLPEGGTGKALVTSRNPEWGQFADALTVDVFKRAESIRLLRRHNHQLGIEDAYRLAAALGDFPLAIEHASAWLVTTGMDVGSYLTLLAQKQSELERLVPAPGEEMPVAAAANVALDRLAEDNPAALQLLQVCSFFAAEPIERDLLARPHARIAPELDAVLQEPGQLDRAIREIQRYVLVRVDHRLGTIQLHRLVRDMLQSRMPSEQRLRMEHGAHLLLASARPGGPSDTGHWLRYHSLASHVDASDAVACRDDWAHELVLNIIAFYYYWGDYDRCRSWAERVVGRWRTMLGIDSDPTLRASKWLGYVWRVLGDVDQAARISTSCLDRYLQTVGADDEGTIDAMLQVAHDHRVAGRFAAARKLDMDAIKRARRVFRDDDPEVLRAAHSLGGSLLLTGDLRGARQRHRDTHRRRAAILGGDHPETLLTLNKLIVDERECGEYLEAHRRAELLYQRHLELYGVDHPETINVARNLAVARRRAGDHNGALKLAEDTARRFEDRFDPMHYEAIAATAGLAIDVRDANELPRAYELAAQSVERYKLTLGPDHPYTLYVATNLGTVLRLLGEPAAAHRHNDAAWRRLKSALGANHVTTLVCAVNLASDLAALGDHESAYDLGSDTLRRLRRSAGAEHPTTLAAAHNLALDLAAPGRSDESAALLTRTLRSYVRVLGNQHPAVKAAVDRARANCDADPPPF
ncbi:MAG TPA: FxSxx-COOH system tetratricopeptide repeat protein [Micromonosporaceae bacterium]|nr:FxSxx-COOH system tetratricopeptide repeat protein [Micromonosporaceae bacterium]